MSRGRLLDFPMNTNQQPLLTTAEDKLDVFVNNFKFQSLNFNSMPNHK